MKVARTTSLIAISILKHKSPIRVYLEMPSAVFAKYCGEEEYQCVSI